MQPQNIRNQRSGQALEESDGSYDDESDQHMQSSVHGGMENGSSRSGAVHSENSSDALRSDLSVGGSMGSQ